MTTILKAGKVRLSCIVFYCDLVQSTQKIKCSVLNMKRHAWFLLLSGTGESYSWIGHSVRTHKKSICRETERVMADLNIRMKSSRQGAFNGGVQKIIFSFFGELFLKIEEICPKTFLHGTVRFASLKALMRRSQVLLKCLSLTANWFLGSPAAVFLLENRSRSSKIVSIGIQSDHNRTLSTIDNYYDKSIS